MKKILIYYYIQRIVKNVMIYMVRKKFINWLMQKILCEKNINLLYSKNWKNVVMINLGHGKKDLQKIEKSIKNIKICVTNHGEA